MGYKITKKTVESIISKSVPVIGGAISGGLTYITFRPMGGCLADVFVKMLNGEYDINLELNDEYENSKKVISEELEEDIFEAEFVESDTQLSEEDVLSDPD